MRTIVGRGYVRGCFKDEISWSIFVYANIHKNIYFIIFIRKGKGEEKEKMDQGCLNVNSSRYRYRNWGKNNLMKRVASPGLMHDNACLGLVHWDDPEGWYGEGGGFRMGNICIPVADSC